jgi:hypothetical protein
VFVILQKDKDHRSSKYNNAPMPYTQRLTWDGVALHAGGLPGYPSSHGCVHLPSKFAEELFAASPMGMTVVVVDEHSAPGEVAHPPAFSPVDATTGVPVSAERLAADEEFRLEPEKAPHGPVSILMSSADQRVLVLRNGVEIGRARITVHDPSEPLGTHTFVMREQPDTSAPTWVAVAMPGHYDEDGRALSHDAAARVDAARVCAGSEPAARTRRDALRDGCADPRREHARRHHRAERRRTARGGGELVAAGQRLAPACAAFDPGQQPHP